MAADCPFCAASLADVAFLEAHGCLAIVNLAPIVPGHCLVVPRRHVTRLADLPEDACRDLFAAAQQTALLLMAVYEADGVDISLQDGASAGQTVDHLHVHVIPRRPHDLERPGAWYDRLLDSHRRRPRTCDEMHAQAAMLRARRQALGL
ncbi:MAG: HIT family protein [Anaerolineae bacterium]|jgi:diadenosine tetraphosphate (Ap4A) HIT family hydrolase